MPTASRNIELLLVENVENLGIVGDVVKAKPGYARNYLIPHGLAVQPSEKRIAELQERRAEVQAEMDRLRAARVELHGRMEDITISITRSCNDQGALYGSVSQRDIADALQENGYDVGIRSVRIGQPIRRVGEFPVPIQFEKDLKTEITLIVEPDHAIGDEREEMEFDNEGELIIRTPEEKARMKKEEEARKAAEEAKAAADAEAKKAASDAEVKDADSDSDEKE